MSEPPGNSLDVQRIYFEVTLQADPGHETIRFALAEVLKELGDENAANACYDEGIDHANRQWLPKLFLFTAITGAVAAGLWMAGFQWPWLMLVTIALGPVLWWLIRRNRQYHLPQIGFMQRAGAVRSVDMAAELARARQEGWLEQ